MRRRACGPIPEASRNVCSCVEPGPSPPALRAVLLRRSPVLFLPGRHPRRTPSSKTALDRTRQEHETAGSGANPHLTQHALHRREGFRRGSPLLLVQVLNHDSKKELARRHLLVGYPGACQQQLLHRMDGKKNYRYGDLTSIPDAQRLHPKSNHPRPSFTLSIDPPSSPIEYRTCRYRERTCTSAGNQAALRRDEESSHARRAVAWKKEGTPLCHCSGGKTSPCSFFVTASCLMTRILTARLAPSSARTFCAPLDARVYFREMNGASNRLGVYHFCRKKKAFLQPGWNAIREGRFDRNFREMWEDR